MVLQLFFGTTNVGAPRLQSGLFAATAETDGQTYLNGLGDNGEVLSRRELFEHGGLIFGMAGSQASLDPNELAADALAKSGPDAALVWIKLAGNDTEVRAHLFRLEE